MYQNLYKATFSKIYSKPLFFLSLWMGVSATLSLGAYTRVAAEDLVIPESGAAPVAPEPAAPPAPEPAAVAPEPFEPAPAAAPIPEPVAPAPRAAAPEPIAPAAPAPKQAQSDPYIDTKDYSVGATEYAPPDRIIVNERASGCQAALGNGQAISSSLCGTPPAQRLYTPPSQTAEQPPAWTRASTPERWNNSAAPASAQTIQNTLQYSAIPPKDLAVKPLTGANPLKWIMENGERMIFPLAIPVQITSVFGWRVHPITKEWRFHSGTDLGAPMGTPVLAAYSGRVSLAELMGGYGLSILLDHNDGKEATRYGHLSEVFVKAGQWVQQGTVIGLVGSTGNSTGPHLHFEALQGTSGGMVAVDPGLELQTTMTALAKVLQTARLTAQQPTTTPTPKVQAQVPQPQS
jgi:murein DD-endopeptidase MepM/ murein hydrolase activator NlpD